MHQEIILNMWSGHVVDYDSIYYYPYNPSYIPHYNIAYGCNYTKHGKYNRKPPAPALALEQAPSDCNRYNTRHYKY